MAYTHEMLKGQRDCATKYSLEYNYFQENKRKSFFFFFELGQHYICSTQPFYIRHDHPLCLSLGNMLLQTAN